MPRNRGSITLNSGTYFKAIEGQHFGEDYTIGIRTRLTLDGGTRVTWTYDSASQLSREQRSGATAYDTTHTYDSVGNRTLTVATGLRTTFAFDAANELLYRVNNATGLTTYTYDLNGNQTLELAADGSRTTMLWNPDNRLTTILLPSGARHSFVFNGDLECAQRNTPDGVSNLIWDRENLLLETDASHATKTFYTHTDSDYGLYVSQRTAASEYFHYDGLGSVTAITDGASAVIGTFDYDAYGNTLTSTGNSSTLLSFVGNLGYLADYPSRRYLVRARVYQPDVARFLSPDSHQSADPSTYRYASNSPTNRVDPSGHLDWSVYDVEPLANKKIGCGVFRWPINFRVDQQKETQGFIIQRVDFFSLILSCATRKLIRRSVSCKEKCSSSAAGMPSLCTYWELWIIVKNPAGLYVADSSMKPGIPRGADDVFLQGSPPAWEGTLGHTFMNGRVYFDKGNVNANTGKLEPSDGWPFWQVSEVNLVRDLRVSCVLPSKLIDTGLKRYIYTIWECCCKPYRQGGAAVATIHGVPEHMDNWLK